MKDLVHGLSADYQDEDHNLEKRKSQVPRLCLPCVPKTEHSFKKDLIQAEKPPRRGALTYHA